MAQSGYTPILAYGSIVASNVPLAGNLYTGVNGVELAVNANDGKLYYKDNGGVVQVLANKALASGTVSFGTTGLTPSTPTTIAGAITVAGTLNIANGGTGATSAGAALTALGAAPTASPTFTGNVTVPTPTLSTQAATKGYADGLAFSSSLPAQAGNAGKYITTDGSTASWGAISLAAPGPIGGTTPNTIATTGETNSGNLTFTGTGNRITGDFSNATIANQVAIQSSTTNGSTNLNLAPNGTSLISALTANNNANIFNSHPAQLIALSTEMRLTAAAINNGGGTYLPMTFYTGGAERMRIGTDGVISGATFNAINGGQLAGLRNRIINGDMRIAQRATSVAAFNTCTAYNSIDRMYIYSPNTSGFVGQVAGSNGFQYMMKFGRTSGTSNLGVFQLMYAIESANCIDLQGKQITFSFYAKAGANFSSASSQITLAVASGTGTDQSPVSISTWPGITYPIATTQVLTTTLTRYSFTGTVPANCTQLGFYISYTPVGTAGADDNLYLTGIQLEVGSTATPFEQRPIGTELALCQRYLPVTTSYASSNAGIAFANSATTFIAVVPFQVTPRTVPTGATIATPSNYGGLNPNGTASPALSGLAFNSATLQSGVLAASGTSGLTAGNATALWCITGSSSIYWTGCEL